MKISEKTVNTIGWIASAMAIAMYFSYIDQIRMNLWWNPWSVILPIITAFNGTLWTLYWSLKEKIDWPIVVCNVPWIIFWVLTALTTLPVVVEFVNNVI